MSGEAFHPEYGKFEKYGIVTHNPSGKRHRGIASQGSRGPESE